MKTLLIGGARSGKSSLAARWAGERSENVCCVVTATASDDEMSARIAAHRQERPQHWRVREEPVRLGAALRAESLASTLLLVDCLTLWTANCLWPPRPEMAGTGRPDTATAATATPATAIAAGATPSIGKPATGTPRTGMPAAAMAAATTVAAASAAMATHPDSDLQPDLAGWQAERDDFLASLRAATNEVIIVSNEVGTGLVPEHAASRLFRDEHGRLNQMVALACDEVFLVTAGLALRLK
jgi:adenosyl cobinamide kinase/adenosyl cobinamide phosphate guanylyltransferase